MSVDVHFTTEAALGEEATSSFLHEDPVRHNVLCTLLADHRRRDEPIRFWWATDQDHAVLGAVFQAPVTYPVVVSALADPAVEPIAHALAGAEPPVDGIAGFCNDSARAAGALASRTRRPGRPVEGQRVYEVCHVEDAAPAPGAPRYAGQEDLEMLCDWLGAFDVETGFPRFDAEANRRRAQLMIDGGKLHLWAVDGVPVASTVVNGPAAGVSRVGYVYTPPQHRQQRYASSLVSFVSRDVLDGGSRCILYTQLENPTSNAIYQRLGYRPVGELVRYELGQRHDV